MSIRSSIGVISLILLTGASWQTEGCRPVSAEGFVPHKDLAYAQEPDVDPNLVSLDIYSPATGTGYPVMVMIHGGGWSIGDKANPAVGIDKGRFFVTQGYIYVSINYRLSPTVMHPVHVEDVAKALAFVHDHVSEYGGDPGRIALMGHSAGAHLAALVATDNRHLEALGKSTDILRGVILLDGAGYNVPAQMEVAGPRLRNMYVGAFGTDVEVQLDASPITHVVPGKTYPPFLIIHVASREDSRAQSKALAAALQEAGGVATVISAQGKTHSTLNRDIGQPGDVPTQLIMAFLTANLR